MEDQKSENKELEAQNLIKAAIRKQNYWFFKPNLTEIAGLYKKAGLLYRSNKNWEKAVLNLELAADLFCQDKNYWPAARTLKTAATIVKEKNINSYINLMEKAIKIFQEHGLSQWESDFYRNIADNCNEKYPETAVLYYRKALLTSHIQEKETLLLYKIKIIELLIRTNDYLGAGQLYEEIAKSQCNDLRYKINIKNWLYYAGICYLTYNVRIGQECLNRFKKIEPSIEYTPHFKFLVEIRTAASEKNIKMFNQLCQEYEISLKMEPWMVSALHLVKMKF